MYWLGIDIGTGGSRALLVDAQGKVKAGFTAPHEAMKMERPLWAEQCPEDWWAAAQKAVQGVLKEAGVSGAEVKAVGLSGQMHGLVLLDEKNEVVRPALIWCDQRSQPQVDAINQTVGKANVVAHTANPMLTGFTLPKLLWVRDNEPANFEKAKKMLLPKDYVRFMLTGEHATEVSDASGTGLLDVVTRRWSGPMIERLKLDSSLLPEVKESVDVSGTISKAAAAATGLKEGTPVVGGAGDQAASGIGNGIVKSGVASCTIGTSGVVFAYLDRPQYDPTGRVHTFCHAVRGKWHVMGVTQGAGLSLQWFRNHFAPGVEYDDLVAEAQQAPPLSHGLYWLPYLMGERTPHLDAIARGGWIGLTAKHGRGDLVRSIIEGVSYSLKDCLGVIEGMAVEVNSVRASGGGAKSLFWRQMLADIFRRGISTLENSEGSAYGAALLALASAGEYKNVEELCEAAVKEKDCLIPSVHESAAYDRGYEVFSVLYPTLKPVYGLIHQLA
ncbi:xylulokinase [Paludibaculum fermentans]|uniref:Xylulose kinase n=1 Tax=Paludibaculum fermentans TaxID=1473598 RepID=A0A7S7NQG9_PALFE|nr:xylulokinase [Paludibaculum fermentans]QOY87870.1 xylulokinase [Paludibaculum fermentans]